MTNTILTTDGDLAILLAEGYVTEEEANEVTLVEAYRYSPEIEQLLGFRAGRPAVNPRRTG